MEQGGVRKGGKGRRGGARGAATPGIGALRVGCLYGLVPRLPLRSLEPRLTLSRSSFFLSHSSILIRLLKASSCELGGLHLAWLLKGTVH